MNVNPTTMTTVNVRDRNRFNASIGWAPRACAVTNTADAARRTGRSPAGLRSLLDPTATGAPLPGRGYQGSGRTPLPSGRRRSVQVMDNRAEIRDFLATRRAKVSPEQAGVPLFGGRRRVPG